jgi:hypothetical protein
MGGYLVLRPRPAAGCRRVDKHALLPVALKAGGSLGLALAGVLLVFVSGGPASEADGASLVFAKPDIPAQASSAQASPISTSAIAPLRPARAPDLRAGLLPARIVPLKAAVPQWIHLAASGTIVGNDRGLRLVEVPASSLPKVVALERGPKVAGFSATAPAPARGTHLHRQATRHAAVSAAKIGRRAPRWAHQMFDNPWQSTAFSYVR